MKGNSIKSDSNNNNNKKKKEEEKKSIVGRKDFRKSALSSVEERKTNNGIRSSSKEFGDLQELSRKILESDSSILALTIADYHGDVLAHQYGAEYQMSLLEKASSVRGRAGIWASIMLGIEREADGVFGPTRYIVRAHSDGDILVIPFPENEDLVLALLTRPGADAGRIHSQILHLLKSSLDSEQV